jgi:hypothetical protein
MNNFVHFMNFMEGRLGAGIKCVKNKINSNFSVEIEQKKLNLIKIEGGVKLKKNLKFE